MAGPPGPAGGTLPAAPAPLLERERELTTLDDAAGALARGDSTVIVIEGPAGIGKSRLMRELRERAAEQRVRLLAARGSELEREFPFGVVRQLVEPALADPAVRERWLAGAAGTATAVVDPPAAGDPAGDATFATLHGLYWLLANAAAEGPLLVAVDDLHWADVPSLRFLAYLTRRIEGLPVLLACALRPSEPGTDAALLAEVADESLAVILRPGPLTDDAAALLVRERLGDDPDDPFRQACHDATGGNPLLLVQLLRSLGDDAVRPRASNAGVVRDIGTRAVARSVVIRLARLPGGAADAAQALAVLGDSADLPTLAALAERPESSVAEAIDVLVRSEILSPESGLAFVHPLVRDAVYRDVPPAGRELMHLRAAHLLDEAGAPAEQVAAHLLLVSRRGDPWAADRLLAAAEGALARGAPEIAVRCLRRALEEPPEEGGRARVLTELALVESQVDLPSSVERLRAAQRVQEDPLARLRIVRTLVFTLIFTGRTDEAVAAATAALRDADPDHEDAAAWVEAFRLVAANFGATAPGTAERLAALRKRPVPEHPGGRARAALSGLDWTVRTGPRAECVAIARSALRDGAVYGHPEGYTLSVGAKLVLEMAEDVAAADAVWQAALDEAHRTGSLFALSTIHLWHGKSLMDRGDLEAARERLDSAGELLELWGIGANTWSMGFLTAAAVGQGRVAEAAELERRIVYDADTSDGSIWALHAIAALRLAEGDHPAALLVTDDIGRRLTLRGIRERLNPAWFPYRALAAQALAGLGRTEEARTLAGEDLALAREWGAPGPIGRALRILGEIEEGAGADGRGLLAEAVATLEGSSRRLELATALASHGAALRRARRPTEAREPLRRALEMAEACGAANLVGHTRTELHATGARPRATARSGPGALTPSERRVVGMAARGETNRDIAQALFVTPKTVELHLSNAYRKLGVRSRRELPEALAAAS